LEVKTQKANELLRRRLRDFKFQVTGFGCEVSSFLIVSGVRGIVYRKNRKKNPNLLNPKPNEENPEMNQLKSGTSGDKFIRSWEKLVPSY